MTQPLPPGPFETIYCDPPWAFKTRGKNGHGRSAERHYPTMPLREIKELPVQDIAAPDCHLFMWTTDPAPAAAFEVIKAWGFKYSGIGFVWIKLNKGEPAFWMTERDFFIGTGARVRGRLSRSTSASMIRATVRRLPSGSAASGTPIPM
jgi:N6-adenosine-specific RNA methylase IME4